MLMNSRGAEWLKSRKKSEGMYWRGAPFSGGAGSQTACERVYGSGGSAGWSSARRISAGRSHAGSPYGMAESDEAFLM